MGYLADIGRTNALSETSSNLTNLALGMRDRENQARQQSFQNALAIKKFEQDTAIGEMNLKAAKYKLEKEQQQDIRDNEYLSLDQIFKNFPATVRQYYEDQGRTFGMVDDIASGASVKRKNVMEFGKFLQTEEGVRFQIAGDKIWIDDIDKQIKMIDEAISASDILNPEKTGKGRMNPKDQQELIARRDQLMEQKRQIGNKIEALKGTQKEQNPTIKTYIKPGTNETMNINEENPTEKDLAAKNGYVPYEAGVHGKTSKKEGKGLGDVTENDFRQYLNDARSSALKSMKFNDPSQLALIMGMMKNPEQAGAFGDQLERSMTKEQVVEYKNKINKYMNDFSPDEVVSEYNRRISRNPDKPAETLAVNPGESATAGALKKEGINVQGGKLAPAQKQGTPVKPKPAQQKVKPQDEPNFWENNLSGLDVTGRRGNLEPVIRGYLAGKMTDQGLQSALDLAGLTDQSISEWMQYIKGLKK